MACVRNYGKVRHKVNVSLMTAYLGVTLQKTQQVHVAYSSASWPLENWYCPNSRAVSFFLRLNFRNHDLALGDTNAHESTYVGVGYCSFTRYKIYVVVIRESDYERLVFFGWEWA